MDIYQEIDKFRQWAKKIYPTYRRYGEWECDYGGWRNIYDAMDRFLATSPSSLDDKQVDNLLYILARDNEAEIIQNKLANNKNLTLLLAKKAKNTLHSNAKWQLAKIIAAYDDEIIDQLLFHLSVDRSYYVQRICLMESAKRASSYAREMIDWAWSTNDQYQRISALWALYWIKDPELKYFLVVAKNSGEKYLMENALQIEKTFRQELNLR